MVHFSFLPTSFLIFIIEKLFAFIFPVSLFEIANFSPPPGIVSPDQSMLTKATIVPAGVSNDSRARPMYGARSAFIATPGILELVSLSPCAIGPFSFETFRGTRPARATG